MRQKVIQVLILSAVIFTVALACRERMIMPLGPPMGDRVVLIEEFTGKGCTNCPKGSREIENLLSLYGEHLVAVSIHAGYFADTSVFKLESFGGLYGKYDLRTDEGEEIFSLLGPNLFYPAGVINRRKFNSEYQHGANVWAGLIAEESALEPEVGLSIESIYDPLSRQMTVTIRGIARVDIEAPLKVSVMLTESGIIDAQDDSEAGGIVQEYVHNHVLRDMLTPYNGEDLAPGLANGEDFSRSYDYVIPEDWKDSECSIIAFVSQNPGGGDIYVLQAVEAYVLE